MFSLDHFYNTLYTNFFLDTIIKDVIFYPFGSSDIDSVQIHYLRDFYHSKEKNNLYIPWIFFYDQEPVEEKIVNDFRLRYGIELTNAYIYSDSSKRLKIIAVSEKSPLVDKLCKEWLMAKWYYFFHGFAALDWYRDLQYTPKFNNTFEKPFLCLNRLCTKDRSYRLTLVANLLERNLVHHGSVSLTLDDIGLGTWQQELNDTNSRLSNNAKTLITKEISKLHGNLVLDKSLPPSHSSADYDHHVLKLHKSALWNIVTETVFYHDKLHLTEKIFKPIVSRRPFILVGAAGNLDYLKSYGFKTFDKWIDESYDNEKDPDQRLAMIVNEIEKICKLSHEQLVEMHLEMEDLLDYNFNHFYGNFKKIIVNEMVDNLEKVFVQWNFNRVDDKAVEVNIDYDAAKKRLLS